MSHARDLANNKRNILKHIEKLIYGPCDEYFDRELKDIIEANDALVGGQCFIFRYRSVRYQMPNSIFKRPPQRIPVLFKELEPRMQRMLDEKEAINRDERPLVLAYVTKILNSANETKELMARLPVVLREPFKDTIRANGWDLPEVNIDAAAEQSQTYQKSAGLLKQRLMTNIILGDR